MKKKNGMIGVYAIMAVLIVIMIMTVISINVHNSFMHTLDYTKIQYDIKPKWS